MCVRDSEANKLEGRVDDLQQQLADTQTQLSEKEQQLASARDTIQQNKVLLTTTDYTYTCRNKFQLDVVCVGR